MLRFKNKIISGLSILPPFRYFKQFSFLLISLILSSTLYSQIINFKNYSTKDGLPSNEVYQVIQDSKGYMWFATDFGVSRFDGYNFINYNSKDGLEYVNTADIVKIEADGSYSNIFLANNKKIFSSKNLKEFQNILNKETFFRAHHSHLINLHQVKRFLRNEGMVEMQDGSMVSLSRRNKEEFIQRMEKLANY